MHAEAKSGEARRRNDDSGLARQAPIGSAVDHLDSVGLYVRTVRDVTSSTAFLTKRTAAERVDLLNTMVEPYVLETLRRADAVGHGLGGYARSFFSQLREVFEWEITVCGLEHSTASTIGAEQCSFAQTAATLALIEEFGAELRAAEAVLGIAPAVSQHREETALGSARADPLLNQRRRGSWFFKASDRLLNVDTMRKAVPHRIRCDLVGGVGHYRIGDVVKTWPHFAYAILEFARKELEGKASGNGGKCRSES